MSYDRVEERVGRNESAFRSINERVEELSEEFDSAPDFVCECDRPDCTEILRITVQTYERARQDGRRFLVKPGHERPAFERVIDQGESWLLVEKIGGAGEVAAEEDSRE